MEAEVVAVQHACGGANDLIAGLVRVTAVPVLVNYAFTPRSNSFLRGHPALSVEWIAESRELSLSKREVGITIRLARPTKELRALARRIGLIGYAVYASSRVRGEQAWITYDGSVAELPPARWIQDQVTSGAKSMQVRVNDAQSLLAAVQSGLGEILLPTFVADGQPGLKRLGDQVELTREVWSMTHPDLKNPARIGLVGDWLASVVAGLR